MRPSFLNFTAGFLLLFLYIGFVHQKRPFGTYIDKSGWGYEFSLKSDFSFTYKARYRDQENIPCIDTATGYYSLKGDTILLSYRKKTYASLSLPDSSVIAAAGLDKPDQLLWQGKKIYYRQQGLDQQFHTDRYLGISATRKKSR